MKVSLDTVEITDEQRTTLADVIDKKASKRKASRAEAKAFIWECGEDWPTLLDDRWNDEFQPSQYDVEDDEDLIEGEDSLEDLL